MSEDRHTFRVDQDRKSHYVAHCSCGWRSDTALTAGLAGALWDRHVADLDDSTSASR